MNTTKTESTTEAFLDHNPNPNHWCSDITLGHPGVLIRYEVVVPVPGGYRIPE